MGLSGDQIVIRQIVIKIRGSAGLRANLCYVVLFRRSECGGGFLVSIIDLFVTQSNSFEQNVVAMMLFGMIAPVNICTFTASLKKLRRRYALDRRPAHHKGTLIPDGTYLEPFAGLIGWSVVMLFATVIVGLLGFVGT